MALENLGLNLDNVVLVQVLESRSAVKVKVLTTYIRVSFVFASFLLHFLKYFEQRLFRPSYKPLQ